MAESDKSTHSFALGIIVTVLIFILLRAEWSKIAAALKFGKGGGSGRIALPGGGSTSYGATGGGNTSGRAGSTGGCGCGGGCGSGKVVTLPAPQVISLGGQSYSETAGYGNSVAG